MVNINKIKSILVIGFVLVEHVLPAQNLAPNPDFEILIKDPTYNLPSTTDWFPVKRNANNPFYSNFNYNLKFGNDKSHRLLDSALFSKSTAKSGTGFWGISLLNKFQIIEAQLIESLKKDSVYKVSLYVSLGERFCFYAVYGFPVFFSGSNLTKARYKKLKPIFLLSDDNMPLIEKENWIQVTGYYKAKGGERFIHIGAYSENEIITVDNLYQFPLTKKDQKFRKVNPGAFNHAYYYIDDINVEMVNSIGIITTEIKEKKNDRDTIPKIMKSGNILWNGYNVQWSDFLGSPQGKSHEAKYGAGVLTGIGMEKRVDKNKELYVEIKSWFYRSKSFYKKNDKTNYVLKHEQLHFDITELFARKLRKDISMAEFNTIKEALTYIKKSYKRHLKDYKKYQKQYDKEVINRNLKMQIIWNEKVEQLLNEYSDYSDYSVRINLKK